MKILEDIWSDVRKGENIDLYATIAISFGIVVLSLVNITPSTLIAPLTLVVLGLLAISSVVNRHRIQTFFDSQTSRVPFLLEFPPRLRNDIENATELYVMGVALTQTVRMQSWIIESLLRKGCVVNVLLVDPNGPFIGIAEYRGRAPRHDLLSELHQTLKVCCSLKKAAPDRLNIRVIPYPLGHCIIAVDPNSSSGAIYIANYSFRTGHPNIPKYILQPKDGMWYESQKEEICSLWDAGTEWDCAE